MRFALRIYYDGRGFRGSQRQHAARTVEGEFLKALSSLDIDYTGFKAAGRTDKGVSALGNVFAFSTSSKLIKPRILNSALPSDIRVLAVKKVESDFNPRHALERLYKYFLLDEGFNLDEMRRAASAFAGTHSFHNFSATDYRSPVRTVRRVDVERVEDILVLAFTGKSFLWQMVRRMVTAMKLAGSGMLSISALDQRLKPDVHMKVPPSAPENLALMSVKYDFEFTGERYSNKRLEAGLEERLREIKVEEAALQEIIRGLRKD